MQSSSAGSLVGDDPALTLAEIDRALDVAQRQVARLITRHPDRIPVYTKAGRWVLDDDPWAPVWTAGFLTGQIWIIAERTGEVAWREAAERYSRLLEHRKLDTGTHDIGFIVEPSWGRWHAISPSAQTREVLIQAGRTMAGRFNRKGRYLSTWVDDGSTFIDVMMNIGIIFQAAELTEDPTLREIAVQHALTSRRYLVRGDASTVHEGWFDPHSGEFLRAASHQGYRSDSCWARGHAWGIHGFGTAYRHTGDERFLATARDLAQFYMLRTGDAYVPPNDWDDPDPVTPYEASAGSAAASGLLQLAELTDEHAEEYARYAGSILARLSSAEFLADPESDWEGVIRHATYHLRNGLGVDESVMWGDYYFAEALWRLRRSAHLQALAGVDSRA